MSSWHAGQRPARRGRRESFRAWRRSRPFWGGLLMLLAGIELLAIPLSGVLIKGQVKLVIYIGIGGVFGVLIGALLVVAGIVVWVNPTHRVFYGIAGLILGILSFPASNLGGFFIGMLLAILGGALAFAWSPVEPGPAPGRDPGDPGRDYGPGPGGTRVDLPTLMDDEPRENRRPSGGYGSGSGGSGFGGPGYRMLAAGGILPCLLFCAATASPASTSSSSSPSPSATASPSPSASASAGKGGGVLPSALPSSAKNALGKAAKAAKPAAGGKPGKSKTNKQNGAKKAAPVNQVRSPSGLVAPSTTSVLTAKSSTLTKLNLVGVTTLPVGGGGSEKVLEFTASSASLSSVGITIHQSGHTVLTKTTSLSMPSGMTLYTTKMCGQVEGIAPSLCFTPDTASQVALKLASVLGQAMPITMTNVSASQFLNVAATSQWGTLSLEAS